MKSSIDKWINFISQEYPLLLKIIAPLGAILYIRHTMESIDSKLLYELGTVILIAVAIVYILLLAKAVFEHKLEIKRLRSILTQNSIDPVENEAVISKDIL